MGGSGGLEGGAGFPHLDRCDLCVCVCVHPEVVLKFRDLISKLEKDVEAVVRLEREERELAASEAKVPDCTSI